MNLKLVLALALISLVSCHYKTIESLKHAVETTEKEKEEAKLTTLLNCNDDGMKANKICFCGTDDSKTCCSKKSKCKKSGKKYTCGSNDQKKGGECKKEIKNGMKYYNEETKKMETLKCDKQTDNKKACYCGIAMTCCKSKDKCVKSVCKEKATTCKTEVEKLISASIKNNKPWFYQRIKALDSSDEKKTSLAKKKTKTTNSTAIKKGSIKIFMTLAQILLIAVLMF